MKFAYWLLIIGLLITFVGCSEGPPTVGEDKAFSEVCNEANKGKRIAVTGYVLLPKYFKKDEEKTGVTFWLYPTNEAKGLPIRLAVLLGTNPNQIEPLPAQYSEKDLKIHLANGQVVGVGTKLKVSATMYIPMVEQTEFKCGLTNPLFELAQ